MFRKRSREESAPQPEGLVGVLTDERADYGSRLDAADDLGEYDEPKAESALALVGRNATTEPDLADNCGCSLGEIWARRRAVNYEILESLKGEAMRMAVAMIISRGLEKESEVLSRIGKTAKELDLP